MAERRNISHSPFSNLFLAAAPNRTRKSKPSFIDPNRPPVGINHPLKSWYDPSVNLIKNLQLSIPDLIIQLSHPNKRGWEGRPIFHSYTGPFSYSRFRLSPLGGDCWAIRVPEWWSGSLVWGYSIQTKAYRRPICPLVPFNETSLTTPTMAQASSHCQAWSLFWYAFRERTWKVLTLRGTWGSWSVFWSANIKK